MSSSSLAEIQELYVRLQECSRILAELKASMGETQVEAEVVHIRLDRVALVARRSLALIRRLTGGDENVDLLVSKLQRVVTVMNQVRMAAYFMYAGLGPVGWVMGAFGLAMTAMDIQDDVSQSIRSVQA